MFLWIEESFVNSKTFSLIQRNRFFYIEENFFESRKLSSIQRNISLIYGQRRKNFELKKVSLIQKHFFWYKEIDFFTLKKSFLNQQNFLQFEDIFSLTLYQKLFFGCSNNILGSNQQKFLWLNQIFLWVHKRVLFADK